MNDGGTAFPRPLGYVMNGGALADTHTQGMTLRDYFAGQALTGILAMVKEIDPNWTDDVICKSLATHAYGFADAMLARREAA
jgi:hypothetical protein